MTGMRCRATKEIRSHRGLIRRYSEVSFSTTIELGTPSHWHIREVQLRLRQEKIGYKKEFLREILKEVRVRGNEVSLTYKLPMTGRTPASEGCQPSNGGVLYTVSNGGADGSRTHDLLNAILFLLVTTADTFLE
jgi:hypothetical protein